MEHRVLKVPASLLLEPDLTASAKVIWMAQLLKPAATAIDIEALTGISRHTVSTKLQHTKRLRRPSSSAYAWIPAALLGQKGLNARAKLLYGLLQLVPGFRNEEGRFTYAELSAQTGVSRNTLKRAMHELLEARWVQIDQENRLGAVRFRLGRPYRERGADELAAAKRRLRRAKYAGEAIMKEYLSLLIDSDQFTDNARPGFLINPLTDEPLEFDRYYPALKVAFEYHGEQHFSANAQFSPQEVKAQQTRDYIKAGICFYRSIKLIVIREADLSLTKMQERVGQLLPLRELEGHEPMIEHLEITSLTYQAESAAARRRRKS